MDPLAPGEVENVNVDAERFAQVVTVIHVEAGRLVVLVKVPHGWEVQNHATVQSATLNHGVQLVCCGVHGGDCSTSEYQRCKFANHSFSLFSFVDDKCVSVMPTQHELCAKSIRKNTTVDVLVKIFEICHLVGNFP